MKNAIGPATVILGLCLLVLSFLWHVLFPASNSWTEDKSARMTELQNQATDLKLKLLQAQQRPSMHAGESAAEMQEQYNQADAEYKELYNEFISASESPKTASAGLKWTGIALTALGGIAVLATRDA